MEPDAVAAHAHHDRLAMAALLEPGADAEHDPLAVQRPRRRERAGGKSRVEAGVRRLEDALPVWIRPVPRWRSRSSGPSRTGPRRAVISGWTTENLSGS